MDEMGMNDSDNQELFDEFCRETSECDLETEINSQLTWLREYKSNH